MLVYTSRIKEKSNGEAFQSIKGMYPTKYVKETEFSLRAENIYFFKILTTDHYKLIKVWNW